MTTTLLTALRQYRHNNGEDFVFGYDKEETDRIVAGLIEDRDQQYAMKCKAREQRDKLAAAPEVDLRDYFAAKVIQGICSSGPDRSWTDDMLACEAYRLADAMLKTRER